MFVINLHSAALLDPSRFMHALQRIERAVKHGIKGLQGCTGQKSIITEILLKSAGDFPYRSRKGE